MLHRAVAVLCLFAVPALADQAGPLVDRSGTVTLGGQSQVAMAANSQRRGCVVQNISAGDLWLNTLGAAAASQPSIWLPAGSEYTCPPSGIPTGALALFGASTGQAFTAREW